MMAELPQAVPKRGKALSAGKSALAPVALGRPLAGKTVDSFSWRIRSGVFRIRGEWRPRGGAKGWQPPLPVPGRHFSLVLAAEGPGLQVGTADS
jgi:hypothetical protein